MCPSLPSRFKYSFNARRTTGNGSRHTFDASVEAPGFWVLYGEGGNDTLDGGAQGNWFSVGTGVNNLSAATATIPSSIRTAAHNSCTAERARTRPTTARQRGVGANLATGIGNTAGTPELIL